MRFNRHFYALALAAWRGAGPGGGAGPGPAGPLGGGRAGVGASSGGGVAGGVGLRLAMGRASTRWAGCRRAWGRRRAARCSP
ncbi:MAG: hypothetical protein WKG07_35005 [Hymenobacter sp.]